MQLFQFNIIRLYELADSEVDSLCWNKLTLSIMYCFIMKNKLSVHQLYTDIFLPMILIVSDK